MKKSLILALSVITLSTYIVPSVVGVTTYADSIDSEPISTNLNLEPKQLSEDAINDLVDELSQSYPSLTKAYLREGIYKQMAGDYSIGSQTGISTYSWQGVTVDQMGAAIDTAIAVALGIGTGGLATALGTFGKHQVQSAIRIAVSKFFGSWFLNSVILDFAMNLASPGTYIAKQWDKKDKFPNNGRINF